MSCTGQGIPDPWTSSCINESEIVLPRDLSRENTDQYLCHSSHCKHLKKNSKRELCLCCKKKYLFKCPDECNIVFNSCWHEICHGRKAKVTDCGKNCRCVEFLQKALLKQKKKQSQARNSESSLSSSSSLDSGAGDKNQNLKENNSSQSYERIRTRKIYGSSADEGSFESNDKRNNRISNKQSSVCPCSYVKSLYTRRIPGRNNTAKNLLKPTSSSKLIQAEIQPIKISKTSQTENPESKAQIKCICSNNECTQFSAYQCKTPWLKSCCSAVSCWCFPLGCFQNSAFICPYFFSNNFQHYNFNKFKNKTKRERNKRKQPKRNEADDESNVKVKINYDAPKGKPMRNLNFELSVHAEINFTIFLVYEKYGFRETTQTKINDYDLKNNKNICCLSNYPKTFDHLKCLTDDKLKQYYFQQEKIPARFNHSPSHSSSKLINFCKKDPSLFHLRPQKFDLEKLNKYSTYVPGRFESTFVNNKISLLENHLRNYNRGRFNHSDQATMTITLNSDSSINTDKVLKERVRSDQSKTYGLDSKAMRKRRRLLTNRKRRKKLVASGKVSCLEYQALLNKLSKEPELVSKQVQVKKTDSECFNLKGVVIFPILSTLNSNENIDLKFENNAFCSEHVITGTWKEIDKDISVQNLNKFSRNETYEDSLKGPLQSEVQLDGVLEKVSCNSGSSWSSSALKNIVNDLLMDEK